MLDPFCGTGTIPLEANLSGRSAIYADANPLARLITRAKTSVFDLARLDESFIQIKREFDGGQSVPALPWVVNVDHWYTAETKESLAKLRAAIQRHAADDVADFFWATFSATARKCSLASPRFAVPVLDKLASDSGRSRDVWSTFGDQYRANYARQRQLGSWSARHTWTACVGTDARSLRSLDAEGDPEQSRFLSNSVDLIITSPPYAGAQKYIRASSLSLGWLGMTGPRTLKQLESVSIGREHFSRAELEIPDFTGLEVADQIIAQVRKDNPLRAKICATYLTEMKSALFESVRVLKPGGRIIAVIGDNTVCGRAFRTSYYLELYLLEMGLSLEVSLVDHIKSRGLLLTRQGGASAIKSETIMVFRK